MNLMNLKNLTHRVSLSATAFLIGGAALAFSGGCATDAQSGLLMGSAAGAGIGAIVGHNTGRRTAEGAAIGAGIGAFSGYVIGNESDKAKSHYHPNYRY